MRNEFATPFGVRKSLALFSLSTEFSVRKNRFFLAAESDRSKLQIATILYGKPIFIRAGTGTTCALSMRVSDPRPVLDKNRAPLNLIILSSAGAGVWRKAPKAFPDSSSVCTRCIPICDSNRQNKPSTEHRKRSGMDIQHRPAWEEPQTRVF